MNRYGPLLVLVAGVSIAVVIAAIELGRDDRLTDVASTVASATPTPAATPEPTAQSVRGRDEPFASNGREWARALLTGGYASVSPKIAVAPNGDIVVATSAPGGQWDFPVGYDWRPNPAGTRWTSGVASTTSWSPDSRRTGRRSGDGYSEGQATTIPEPSP